MRTIDQLSKEEKEECEMLGRAALATFNDIKEEAIERDLSEDEVWEERFKVRQWVKGMILDILSRNDK